MTTWRQSVFSISILRSNKRLLDTKFFLSNNPGIDQCLLDAKLLSSSDHWLKPDLGSGRLARDPLQRHRETQNAIYIALLSVTPDALRLPKWQYTCLKCCSTFDISYATSNTTAFCLIILTKALTHRWDSFRYNVIQLIQIFKSKQMCENNVLASCYQTWILFDFDQRILNFKFNGCKSP